ncbi:unnamed protein product [Brugia timori]|uniref:Uncharacterized protein n=1 Tax=Brugia timori TaxID=42155 RepID=A0A0R3Q3Y3_9BILA|nr:unnamed protein product [Brugia timori]
MFSNVVANIEPVKERLVDLLKEINAIYWHLLFFRVKYNYGTIGRVIQSTDKNTKG